MWWLGIDVGGTFTDGVAYDGAGGEIRYEKAPSTPSDPTQGVLDVIARLRLDMRDVERFVHGVTIGTNAILQGKGAECWMLVTEGFADVLEIGRTNRPVLYDIKTLKQQPLVPRARTLEVGERLYYDGSVRKPLDEAGVRAALGILQAGGAAAVAVCLLHSYADPTHERRVGAVVQAALPGCYVSLSSDVLPVFREYERFNTTALNTAIGPLMAAYLARLRAALSEAGFTRRVFITTSNGGVSTAERAIRLPISTVLSGPAGGVAAAVHLGRIAGFADMITCDMGGTSTDVCLIEKLAMPMTNEQFIGGYANRTPQIAINAVGAGGGSIAWVDRGTILKVGPQSAGAWPGPACYGQGGTEPTVTDANLLLNRLNDRLAGGIAMDRGLALAAIRRLGAQLDDMDPHVLAEGLVRIAAARMVSAIKQISVANGYDPRDFVLVAFGGAGPMHACLIAEELDMGRVLIPVAPGNFCALGSLISDIRRDHVLTRTMLIRPGAWPEIQKIFSAMEIEARAGLLTDGLREDSMVLQRSLGMRYLGQSWELPVDLPPDLPDTDALEAAFAGVHDRRFGHKTPAATEIVTFRVAAIGRTGGLEPVPWHGGGSAADASVGHRDVFFIGAFTPTALYRRPLLAAGATLTGPAVIDEDGATTIVAPGWRATVLVHGELLLERTA